MSVLWQIIIESNNKHQTPYLVVVSVLWQIIIESNNKHQTPYLVVVSVLWQIIMAQIPRYHFHP